jgi:hypothetical protein
MTPDFHKTLKGAVDWRTTGGQGASASFVSVAGGLQPPAAVAGEPVASLNLDQSQEKESAA